MQRTGWFKFHRQTFDNPVCMKDAEYFLVWCWLLNEACYEEKDVLFDGERITLKKGQLITTLRDISKQLNISYSKINRILNCFKSETQIETRSTSQNTLITVLNWEKYQSSETQIETRVKHERNTSETRVKHERNTNEKPSYYNKELKNLRNKEIENKRIEEDSTPPISPSQGEAPKREKPKEPKHHYGEYSHVLLTDRERDRLFNDYGEAKALEAIKYLDEYIEEKGYTAKSHNLTLRRWVFNAVEEQKQRERKRKGNGGTYQSQTADMLNASYDMMKEWVDDKRREQQGNDG